MNRNPFLIGLLCIALFCLSGCVSSASYEALRNDFKKYVAADKKKKAAMQKHFENHTDKDSPLIKAQLIGLDSWQKRIDKAEKGLNQQ